MNLVLQLLEKETQLCFLLCIVVNASVLESVFI